MSSPAYYHYWGKAQPNLNKSIVVPTTPYHLLVYHSLDVAATAYHLLHDDAPIMVDLSSYLKIDPCRQICTVKLGRF